MKGLKKQMKWYATGLRQLLDETTDRFNALPVETRIELLRLCPDFSIVVSRLVRYHEATRVFYAKKEGRR